MDRSPCCQTNSGSSSSMSQMNTLLASASMVLQSWEP